MRSQTWKSCEATDLLIAEVVLTHNTLPFLCIIIPHYKSDQYGCSVAELFVFPKYWKIKKSSFFSPANCTVGSCCGPGPVVCSPPARDHLPLLCLHCDQHSRKPLPYTKGNHNRLLLYPVVTLTPLHSYFLIPSLNPFNKQDRYQPDPMICILSKFPSPSLSA